MQDALKIMKKSIDKTLLVTKNEATVSGENKCNKDLFKSQ